MEPLHDNHPQKNATSETEPPTNEKLAPRPSENEKPADQKRFSWYRQLTTNKKIEFWSGVLVAGSTAVMAAFSVLLWITSTSQVGVMRDQFDASHRPWIEPTISVVDPLTFQDNYAQVGVKIALKNGGTAPALGAEPLLSLILVGNSSEDKKGEFLGYSNEDKKREHPVLKNQDIWCRPDRVSALHKVKPSYNRQLLLPNSQVTLPIWRLQNSTPWRDFPNGEVYAAWISGCITYVDEFGTSHATLITLLFATSYPFKPTPGLTVISGSWVLAPYGHGAY